MFDINYVPEPIILNLGGLSVAIEQARLVPGSLRQLRNLRLEHTVVQGLTLVPAFWGTLLLLAAKFRGVACTLW